MAMSSGAPQSSPAVRRHAGSCSSSNQSCFPLRLRQKLASEAARWGVDDVAGKEYLLLDGDALTGEMGSSL
jgi:hypothetical protein